MSDILTIICMYIRAIKSSQQVSEGRSGRSFEETEGEVLSCLPKATELGNGRLRPRAQNNLCRNMAVGDGGGELLTEKGSKSFRAAIERIRSCVPRPEIFTLTRGHTAPRKQRLLLGRVPPPTPPGSPKGKLAQPTPPRQAPGCRRDHHTLHILSSSCGYGAGNTFLEVHGGGRVELLSAQLSPFCLSLFLASF